MNWKVVAALLGLAGTGLIAWKTHLYMDARAIAVYGSEGWIIQKEGWSILQQLWPAAILIALVFGMAGTALIAKIYGHAVFADESERVKEAQQAQREAERERDQAYASERQAQESARRNLDIERATVEKFRQQLLAERDRLQRQEAEAAELKERAIAALNRADAIEARAKRRQENASAAYNRKKQQLKKLEAKIAQLG